jgi:hypothetical protein
MNESVILIAYIIMLIVGIIIGIIVGFNEPIIDNNRSVLTKKEYRKYMSQTKQAASVAHGGGKLCPDKDVMEVVSEGAKDSDFKFPKIDF